MEKRPHYHGHRQRLKERLRKDPKALADYEILELLLAYVLPQRDTKPLSKELLARFGTIRGVFNAPLEQLLKVKGFGPALETYWIFLREFWARQQEGTVLEKATMSGPEVVAEFAMARLGHRRSEEFWVALVDNKNRLMGWEQVSRGTVDQAPVYPREVLALALKHEASGVVLVHNHPGGDPKPSGNDLELTRRIARASVELGVRILDHLVVTDNGYYSFKDKNLL